MLDFCSSRAILSFSFFLIFLEILNFLDKQAGKNFDRNVANQLFEQCQTSEFEDLNLVQFVDSYALAVTTLRKKIKQTTNEKKALEEEYKEVKAQTNNTGPEPGDNGLMDLYIRVIRGKNFDRLQILNTISPFVSIKVASQENKPPERTEAKEGQSDPYWDRTFKFLKLDANEATYVELGVYHEEKVKEPTLLGTKRVYLRDFMDQQRKELKVNFDSPEGDEIKVSFKCLMKGSCYT